MKKFKAKVGYKAKVEKVAGEYEPLIYVSGRWRSFGPPFSRKDHSVSPYKTNKSAVRAANTMAAALGITLVWEG